MKCSKCEFENRIEVIFCEECGTKLELICPKCGARIPQDRKFCGKCGHNLQATSVPTDYSEPHSYTPKFLADKILTTRSSLEGERKLVTVLFADVADFTSLSEKLDPEEVHQIMDGCFKILMDEIHKFEGTINQFTGDGVMALFGAPVAHEDHAQRACHAALSIQNALKAYSERIKIDYKADFKMRIGLNSGPVIVGSIGDDLRMDYTAIGDSVNLASRMESLAHPGTVFLSENTYKIVREFFVFETLGEIDVKGKEQPQAAFKLIGKSEIETRLAASAAKGLTRFVGRQNSMAALMEAYDKVMSGAGQVIGIVGEAGVGKSRLVLEFKNQLSKDESILLEGRCIHYGGAMAYLPVLDILKSYFDISDDDSEFAIRKKIKDKIIDLDENSKTALTPFHDLFSLKVDDQAYLQVGPAVRKMRIFESLMKMFVRESLKRPLVIVFEDLHWIDKISEEFINYFIDWIPNTKILVVLLYRPEYTHQWGSKSHYTKIGLTQLGTDSSRNLLQAILDEGEITDEIKKLILQKAGGNPLFVEELTHNLMENGSIEKKNHQYVLTKKTSEIQVPETLQGIIASRIDRVEESLKQVMQMASVIGREFAFRILESIMGMREELKSSLLNLQGLEFISEKQLFPELEYIFKHALTQEVAYNSLLHKRKKAIHEKVAQSIETLYPERIEEYYELLAYHYRRSDNADKALDYLDKANQKAARLNAMQEAISYFDEAMEILDTLDETPKNKKRRISLIYNQLWVFMSLLRMQDYHDLLIRNKQELENIGDSEVLVKFYSAISGCEYWFGHFDATIKTASLAIKLGKASGQTEYAHWAYIVKLWSYCWIGEFEKVHELRQEILSLLENKFNLQLYYHVYCTASIAFTEVGYFDIAIEAMNKAMSKAEAFSDISLMNQSLLFIAWAHNIKGEKNKALEYTEAAVLKAQTPREKITAQGIYAWILCHTGDHKWGIEILNGIIPLVKAARYQQPLVNVYYFLSDGYWFAEEYDNAIRTLNNLLDLAERQKMKPRIGFAHYLLGEIALKKDPATAPTHFEKSIDILKEIKSEYYLARAYAGYGRYHKKKGDMTQARHYLTKALEIFERLEILNEPDKVKKELVDLLPFTQNTSAMEPNNEMPKMPK